MQFEAPRLRAWDPTHWPVADDWLALVRQFLHSPSGLRLGDYLQGRLAAGATIYPATPFLALQLTPLAQVKVVILGQDPYHGPGQAHGLAFSVARGVPPPPSLRNILAEVRRCGAVDAVVGGLRDERPQSWRGQTSRRSSTGPGGAVALSDEGPQPWLRQAPRGGARKLGSGPAFSHEASSGNLEHWARQGVLLLNTCLTVEQGQPGAHANRGWEALTDKLVEAVARAPGPRVVMLWGARAQSKLPLIDACGPDATRLVLCANHPSPLSARRPPVPFVGCGHFRLANEFLMRNSVAPVSWTV